MSFGRRRKPTYMPYGGQSSGNETPPPAYAISGGTDDSAAGDAYPEASSCRQVDSTRTQLDLAVATDPISSSTRLPDTQCGVDWRFASQGLNLLGLAADEAANVKRTGANERVGFGRQAYIHAITYLLKGLPKDLSAEEQVGLGSALPVALIEPAQGRDGGRRLAIGQGAEEHPGSSSNRPSVLHRTVAMAVFQLFVFMRFLLPYIKILLRNAYVYERKNHVTERVLASSMTIVDSLGKMGFEYGGAISRMGNGRMGHVFQALAAWWVEGITGGVFEGVGDGLIVIGAPNDGALPDSQ
ncbi:MAG: hypothetical protein M1825_001581 [Sarcosagium campestre]|nr:MAG: hypothetical protein M1825_001581 [Sarcosagium campestre]